MTGRGVRVEDVRIMIFRIGTMLVCRSWMLAQVRHEGEFHKGVSVSTS